MSYKERASRGAPCIFCGDVGRDMRVFYPETEDVVHWCHKVKVAKGDLVSADGKQYICIDANHETAEKTMGGFSLFKEYLSKEEWMAKQERINPDWVKSRSSARSNTPKMQPVQVAFKSPSAGELLEGEEKPLSDSMLDKVYRAFLSLLVLEDKHRDDLLKEWKSPIHDVSYTIKDFFIRSLPPPDKPRFKSSYPFKNPTRKSIVSKLFDMFGSLRGVPGFYMRTGEFWDDKPEKERWTIAFAKEGVIFPCFNKNGLIYRLRIKDDFPDLRVKEGSYPAYKGDYGYFTCFYDREGIQKCHFVSEQDHSQTEVPISDRYGKPRGKYKAFASCIEKRLEDRVINAFYAGTRSGNAYSLYTHPSDNPTVVFFPEGEKKGIVTNAVKKFPAVSIPGTGNYNVIFTPDESGESLFDYLVKKGAKFFVICYDADKEVNEDVAANEIGFANAIKAHGGTAMVASWKRKVDKGIDDILLKGFDITISPI